MRRTPNAISRTSAVSSVCLPARSAVVSPGRQAGQTARTMPTRDQVCPGFQSSTPYLARLRCQAEPPRRPPVVGPRRPGRGNLPRNCWVWITARCCDRDTVVFRPVHRARQRHNVTPVEPVAVDLKIALVSAMAEMRSVEAGSSESSTTVPDHQPGYRPPRSVAINLPWCLADSPSLRYLRAVGRADHRPG